MFELASLQGTRPKSITLQTRTGRDIPNEQALPPTPVQVARYEKFRQPHPKWVRRSEARGLYNCHGMVWAARRTAVYEDSWVRLMLADDGYLQVAKPQAGDLALYVDDSTGIIHVALVMDPDTDGQPSNPTVLSKWSDHYGEDLHAAYDVPAMWYPLEIQWWSDVGPGRSSP